MLFLGERNGVRTIYAEALLKRLGRSAFEVYSAGRNPSDHISAHALETLSQAGYDMSAMRPQSWNVFVTYTSPTLDVVITLEDDLKDGPFPIWYCDPVYVHWPFPSPEQAGADDATRRAAYRRLYGVMEQQILKMMGLDLTDVEPSVLRQRLQSIAPD